MGAAYRGTQDRIFSRVYVFPDLGRVVAVYDPFIGQGFSPLACVSLGARVVCGIHIAVNIAVPQFPFVVNIRIKGGRVGIG